MCLISFGFCVDLFLEPSGFLVRAVSGILKSLVWTVFEIVGVLVRTVSENVWLLVRSVSETIWLLDSVCVCNRQAFASTCSEIAQALDGSLSEVVGFG